MINSPLLVRLQMHSRRLAGIASQGVDPYYAHELAELLSEARRAIESLESRKAQGDRKRDKRIRRLLNQRSQLEGQLRKADE